MIKVATDPSITIDHVSSHLLSSIRGKQAAFSDEKLGSAADLARIRKVYKLGPGPVKPALVNGTSASGEGHLQNMETQIIGAMALRGAS